ncbi:hypothetical protein GIB67_028254 [Kingdonia uniflora]|uniref:protein-tyrosine-phosphatase n=1 Tax=Kingdonia uniflora TaxID=39325 RepID=A0A7J7KZA3_9MAGN|nr:hypothetical protein GIB67_028254 [Kingdonia uniflora]
MPSLVRNRLYLGDICDAAEILQNGSPEITHILSIFSTTSISYFSEWHSEVSIVSKEIRKVVSGEKILHLVEYAGKDLKFVRMAASLEDVASENLLDCLEVCLNFIDESRKHGSVLVHCFAGQSRSAAVMTAYLMRTEQLSLEDALTSLRLSRETVCPNDGFLYQLKSFENMGFKIDLASPLYKRFRMRLLGDSYDRGEIIDFMKFAVDPGLPAKAISSKRVASSKGEDKPDSAYCCKKCRRVVAVLDTVVQHTPGEKEIVIK